MRKRAPVSKVVTGLEERGSVQGVRLREVIEVRVKEVAKAGVGEVVSRVVPLLEVLEGVGRRAAVPGVRGASEPSVGSRGGMEAAGDPFVGVCSNRTTRCSEILARRKGFHVLCNVGPLQNGHEHLLWELRQIQSKLNLNTTEAVTSEIEQIKEVESNMNIVPEHSEIRRQFPVNVVMNFSEDSSEEEVEVGPGKRFVRNGFGRMSTVSSRSVGGENFKVR